MALLRILHTGLRFFTGSSDATLFGVDCPAGTIGDMFEAVGDSVFFLFAYPTHKTTGERTCGGECDLERAVL